MNARPKVLLVANNFPPIRGGSASVYGNLARCADGEIMVLAPSIDYTDGLPIIGWREHDRSVDYKVIRLPLLRTEIATGTATKVAKLRTLCWDLAIRLRVACVLVKTILLDQVRTVCVGELLSGSWIIRFLRFIPGVRTVAYVHGEEITTSDSYDSTHARARQALLQSDCIITVSKFTYHAVEALVGTEAGKDIQLVSNGVDTDKFGQRAKPADLLRLYDLVDRFVFVSVSRLVEKKGTDNTIRAFAQVAARHNDCRLLIVGSGPYRDTLERIVDEAGLHDHVVFTGSVGEAELAEHYQLGDVFVMPNRELPNGDTEGFGVVFLEANACGLPAIAGCDGGSVEAVEHGTNGLVVDGRKVDEIADAMLRLREDRALYATLQRNGLEGAAHASWRFKMQSFLKLCSADQPRAQPSAIMPGISLHIGQR